MPHRKRRIMWGAQKCKECHSKKYEAWAHSRHPKMIQDIKKDPSVVVADFSKLPQDSDFTLKDAYHKKDRDMKTLQNDLEKWGMVSWDKR